MRAGGAAEGRVLIAGVGNVLRRDDGFGPAVAAALQRRAGELPARTTVLEVGIGGVGLIQELLDGYGALIIVDAVDRQAAAGTLFVLEPEVPAVREMAAAERRLLASDMHQLVPARSLLIAEAFDVLPPRVRIVGCQPAETEELSTDLSPAVAASVAGAVETVIRLAHELSGRPPASEPGAEIRRRDELLQVMFWLRGEGLGEAVGPDDVGRLLAPEARATLEADLDSLCGSGLAEPCREGRYRLTAQGMAEGGRRFEEEFSDYVHPGHGACSDPACDCHTLGPDACVHAREVSSPGGE